MSRDDYITPARRRSAAEFREAWRACGDDLDCDTVVEGAAGPLGAPLEVAGKRLVNRFCVHPMEGWDGTPDGAPSELTLRRWRGFGRSAAALVWGGEAYAVRDDGRANPNQLVFRHHDAAVTDLARLRAEVLAGRGEAGVAEDDVLVGLQLTHSGRYAAPTPGRKTPRPPVRHPVLDARVGVTDDGCLLSDAELEAIGERYVAAARAAAEAGFDFVDVKCCHGYLLHELLGARPRPGPYGGDFEGRTRLFRDIVGGIRDACPGLAIGVRVSYVDIHPHGPDPEGRGAPLGWDDDLPYRHGFGVDANDPRRPDLDEPARFLALLGELGIGLLNVSVGSPYYTPHVQRPARFPPFDGYGPPEDPLASVAFQVRATRHAKRAAPDMVVVGSGYTYLQEWIAHVAQHEIRTGQVDFVGLGRMMLSYPEFAADVLAGRTPERRRICRTFSDCTNGPRAGMISGCYPLDPEYRQRPERERLEEIKATRRRREHD